jgi:hypothetical protein
MKLDWTMFTVYIPSTKIWEEKNGSLETVNQITIEDFKTLQQEDIKL